MKKLLSILALAGVFLGSYAQDDGTVIFDLTTQTAFNQCAQRSFWYDHDDITMWVFSSYSYTVNLYNYNVAEPYYDDYLITPALEMKAGRLYRVTTAPYAEVNGKTVNLYVYYGQGSPDDAENFTLAGSFKDLPYYSNSNNALVPECIAEFTVPEDGNYRVAFRGEPNKMYMARTKILEYAPTTVPATVTDFTVLPDPDGASKATVTFTVPATTRTGQDLTGEALTYNIYRGEDLINTGTANGGTPISYTDNEVTPGDVTYSLEIARGDEKTDLISVNTFIGVETPNPVTDLTLTGTGGAYLLTWTAPSVGTHGASLDPAKLTYQITRHAGEDTEVIATDNPTTQFTDDFESSELIQLSYEVVAKYSTQTSEPVTSNSLRAGSMNLPFADSFANAQIDGMKWEVEKVTGTYEWQAAARVGSSPSNLTKDAYDGDGGLAYYNFFNATAGSSSRLMTMPISNASTTSPVVDFHLWRHGVNNDRIKLQIQIDGGEWQDIEGAEYSQIANEGEVPDENGWYNYTVGFGSYIPENCSTYRIAFTAVSNYGYNMAIDAVRIFNMAGSDLAISSVSAPESIVAGNDIELVINVSNNGADVASDDYTIVVDSNYPQPITVESVAIASLGSHQFRVAIPVTAEEAYDQPTYNFTAKLIYDADEVEDNNESETVEVTTGFSEFNSPEEVQAEFVDNNPSMVKISWASAKDLSYTPVNIIETFDDLEKDATGNFNGWVSIDLDQQEGSYHYNVGSSEFTVTNGGSPSGGSGNYIGVTTKSGSQQDDWLISPEINCKDGSLLNFSAKVACKNVSSSYSIHLELMYSEEEYDAENPASSFQSLKSWSSSTYGPLYQNASFCTITYEGIPSTAKYVALHFDTKTNYDMAIWVDDLKVYEEDTTPLLGYNVYERNSGRMNEEPLDDNTLEYVVTDKTREIKKTRIFYVTGIYPDGESAPSAIASLDVSTQVEDILDAGKAVVSVNGGVMISGYEGETAEVYTIDGQRVASMKCAEITVINLNAGIYVVKVGAETRKVMIK